SDGTYCWQVDSINAYDVASAFSPSRTFTVQQEVPPSVTLDSYTNPVSQANETSASASGTVGSPVNTVDVTVTGGGESSAGPFAATVNSEAGTWSVSGMDLSSLPDGSITYTATASNDAGSNSASAGATKDTTP